MIKETMTSTERVLAAINLEPYDRVPVAPHINSEFPFRHNGRPTSDAYNLAYAAEGQKLTLDLWDEVGGWDAQTLATGAIPTTPRFLLLFATAYGESMRYPGQDKRISDTGSPQFAEREALTVDDYDKIIEQGWYRFLENDRERVVGATVSGVPFAVMPLADLAKGITAAYVASKEIWNSRGVPVMSGALLADPQMILSLLRTLRGFTMDMYRYPEKVKAVMDIMSREITQDAIDSMLLSGPPSPTGIPGIMIACERGSGQYYNLNMFEQFVWPYIKEEVEAWWTAGYVTTLHFDTDWTRNLPYLLELPRKSCICELDSTTDIFKAKEILGDHMCIMGDVPPALSSHGTPEEMQAYCQKLIDIVGKDTGFILSTGCAVPPDTKYENYKMMIDTAKNYPPPRSK
jgi:hypothetical protein